MLWLRLLAGQRRLQIEVWDTLPGTLGDPAPRRASPEDESGRGLEMVRQLSLDFGWDHPPGQHAKRVWALLAVPAPPLEHAPAAG